MPVVMSSPKGAMKYNNRNRINKMNCSLRRVAELTVVLLCIYHTAFGYGGDENGPRFVVEPPLSVFFSNATGARVVCVAEGYPQPVVYWQTVRDGLTVMGVGDLMHVDEGGTLVFSPFAENQFNPDVHLAAYRCVAHSHAGTIVSRTVHVRAEVIRNFEPIVRDTVTMPGNVALFSCHIPGIVYNENNELPESVAITSWVQDGVFNIFPTWDVGKDNNSDILVLDNKIIMVPKTGQLRIANVDQNDLRHSYTCRIVNKLTGFTQESSTFGRIYFETNRTIAPWTKSLDYTVNMVKLGDHLLLPCDVYGFPPPTVTWSSDSSTLIVSAETFVKNGQNKTPMNFLRIRSVQKTDGGNYTCTARNMAGIKTLHHLVVVLPDMSAHVLPAKADIECGQFVSFTCITSANDDSQIVTWLKDGQPRQSSTSTPPTYTLNIDSVQKEDQGMYQCVVTNKMNTEMAHSFAELRLSASKPVFKYKFIGHLLKPGPDVSLKCIAMGTPTPQITWKFDGNDVSLSDMRISVSQYVTENGDVVSHFNISKVKVEDGGLYECTVTNKAGQISHSAKLQIYGDPVAKRSPKIVARAGQQLQMACPISGYPIFNINWEKDGKKLMAGKSQNKRYKVFTNGSMLIENVQKKTDQGKYYCEASNDKNKVKASVDVTVIEPPHIHPFTIDSGYHEGGRVGWQCFITKGDGPLNIQWLKDGQSLDPAAPPPLSVTYPNQYSSSVAIESILVAHEGNYTCRVSNSVATVEHAVKLTVLAPPEITPFYFSDLTEGSRVQVACTVHQGDLPLNLTWLKDGVPVRQGSGGTEAIVTPFNLFSTILSVNNVTRKDAGDYTCLATNPVHRVTYMAHLNVNVPPEWLVEPKDMMNIVRDDRAEVNCSASGQPKPKIKWKKGSSKDSDQFIDVVDNVTADGKLIISKVTKKHEGVYMCEANNDVGPPILSYIRLNVQDLPHIILANTKYTSVDGGGTSMSCEATGDQPIHISWIKGSVQLNYKNSNLRYNVEEMYTETSVKSKLIISRITTLDSGRYVCVAENSLGKHEAAMELEVKELGSPPDDLACNITTSNSVKLRWTDFNANKQMSEFITGYVITYSKIIPPDDLINEYNEIEIYHNGEEMTISNLDTFSEYMFTIKVDTSQGMGRLSNTLICQTLEKLPEPPAAVKAIHVSSNVVFLTWLPPIHANGRILHYTLYEQQTMEGMQTTTKTQMFEPHVRSTHLTIINKSSSYLWWVTVTNTMGQSDKSMTSTLSSGRIGGAVTNAGSFYTTMHSKWHVDVDIPCLINSSPSANVKWTFDNQFTDLQTQHLIFDNYTLHLESVTSSHSGNYTCTVWNQYGSENVTISLLVIEPPKPPIISLVNVSWTNITVNWKKAPDTYAVQQYLVSYKYVNDSENIFNELALPSRESEYTLTKVKCSTTVAFSISASNRVGHGIQSRPYHVKTLKGEPPIAPPQNQAIEQIAAGFLIHLQKWTSDNCPITHFAVYKRLRTEKEWMEVNEHILPNSIYSIEALNPSTEYDILVKCMNSAGVTSTIYTATTLLADNDKYDKGALSLNEKIMHTFNNIMMMWPALLATGSVIGLFISLILCYKYRRFFKKNQRTLEADSGMPGINDVPITELNPEPYETCVPFKTKITLPPPIEDPSYNEISPYATFQISPSKSSTILKQYFCTNCGDDLDLCHCNKMCLNNVDYTNSMRNAEPIRMQSYSDDNDERGGAPRGRSIHELYDMDRSSQTCEPMKKPKRRLLPLPDTRRGSSYIPRERRSANLHETTFMMPTQHRHRHYHHEPYPQNDSDDEDTGTMGRGLRRDPYRVCY